MEICSATVNESKNDSLRDSIGLDTSINEKEYNKYARIHTLIIPTFSMIFFSEIVISTNNSYKQTKTVAISQLQLWQEIL